VWLSKATEGAFYVGSWVTLSIRTGLLLNLPLGELHLIDVFTRVVYLDSYGVCVLAPTPSFTPTGINFANVKFTL
jgi:hypothetical protein